MVRGLTGDMSHTQVQRSSDGMTIDVLIELPGHDCNIYEYDKRREAIRLKQVHYATEHYPVDWGIIPHTLTPEGSELDVLLVTNQSNFPGCLVLAHPIGFLERRDGSATEQAVVAVPLGDSQLNHIHDIQDLPYDRRHGIEILYNHRGEQLITDTLNWHGAVEAEYLIHEARRRATLERLEGESERGRRGGFGWKAGVGLKPRWLATEMEAHTAAEYAVHKLPYRFQEYVEDCLLPEERILLFISRPPVTSRWSFIRRKQLNEGILVITDRQVMMMTDTIPPDSTLVHWGYKARVSAIERLSTVYVNKDSSYAVLKLVFEALAGKETMTIEFPTDQWLWLERAKELLERFIPGEASTALRRLYQTEGQKDRRGVVLVDWDDPAREASITELSAVLPQLLGEGEEVLAKALAPSWPAKRRLPTLLAVTNQRVLLLPTDYRRAESDGWEAYAIGELSSVELHHSLLGCWIELAVPAGDIIRRIRLEFESPSIRPFRSVFSATRQLMGQPFASAELQSSHLVPMRDKRVPV
ncbi:MAG: inorganic diphosphatase [Chloroflexi bacterium]|nr:inorganic diphosphatase [Chloroflexota bacterium]